MLDIYASKIRHLTLKNASSLYNHAFDVIETYRKLDTFLPNLRSLKFAESCLMISCKLSGANLLSFQGNFTYDEYTAESTLLDGLGERSPLISELELSVSYAHLSPGYDISRMLSSLSHLKKFHYPQPPRLTSNDFAALAALTDLKDVTIYLPSDFILPPLSGSVFSNLEHLAVHQTDFGSSEHSLEPLPELLKALSSTALNELEVLLHGPAPTSILEQFCHALSHSSARLSVAQIQLVQFGRFGGLPGIEYAIWPQNIRPLLACTNLEVLRIDTKSSFEHLNDDLMREIAMGMPQLRALTLGTSFCFGKHTQVTFDGLIALAQGLRLIYLGLSFDTNSADTLLLLAHNVNVKCITLVELDVGHSPLSNAHDCAAILAALFPRLQKLKVSPWLQSEGEGSYRQWMAVEQSLDSVKDATRSQYQ